MEKTTSKGKAGGMTEQQRPGYGSLRRRRVGGAATLLLLVWALSCPLFQSEARGDTASLTLDVASLTFPASDPDITPQIAALENPVTVTVRVRGAVSTIADLTILAAGDLLSSADSIPITGITWTATGAGFVAGTLSKIDPQTMGHWFGKNIDVQGSLWFRLANSWGYPTGTYSQTLMLTLASY